jgi:DNA-binding transcriptional LysR family regulator
MASMSRLEAVDLNLLVCLGHLLEAQSVSTAAKRMRISQPTMSHHLGTLREMLGDPLLLRRGRRMTLTARGQSLRPIVERALDSARAALSPKVDFDPKTARGELHIAASDYGGTVVLDPFLRSLRSSAPGLDLRMQPLGLEVVQWLGQGPLDLALAPERPFPGRERFVYADLFRDRFVCAMSRAHPLAKRMTLQGFASANHVLCAPSGEAEGIVDRTLAKHGLTRRIVATSATFVLALDMVRKSDLIVTLPERLVNAHARGLEVRKPPIDVDGFTLQMIWHPRWTTDRGHRWLRNTIKDVVTSDGRTHQRPRS